MSADSASAPAASATWRDATGFWAVAFAFLIVMAFATLPSPLYGLYRTRDNLSAFTITLVYAIWAGGTIAALLAVPAVASRIGRRASSQRGSLSQDCSSAACSRGSPSVSSQAPRSPT